jgi:OOP family OmpA-OmpF porin
MAAPVAAVLVSPPAPPPAAMVVPVPARTEEYCAVLDIQFEIDQDDMQREVKEKLAVLATFMKKYPDNSAVIEGHTDDVGTDEYNMKLSQRRADSVVDYLVRKHGITPSRLTAVGYGETRPLADNASEEGKRQNRRIDAVIGCVTDIAGLRVVPARITMALLIEFDRNQADVKPEYSGDLRKVSEFMREHPAVTATVEGHTGNLQGTPELAMEISQRRARNVVNTLVDNFGIARSRLSAEGFGQTRRVAYSTSREGQQENRRVNVIFNFVK